MIFRTVSQTGGAWASIICVKGPMDPAGFWGLVHQAKGLYLDQNIILNDVQSGLVVGSQPMNSLPEPFLLMARLHVENLVLCAVGP